MANTKVSKTSQEANRAERQALGKLAGERARKVLKYGDRVGATACPGRGRTFQFACFFGDWIVSKTGLEFHPMAVYSVNGKPVDFKKEKEDESQDR